ncbi:hypothetical protein [Devosia sp. 2618]|uniref:hypothetical protein n=1 Tax=Devosia sp. 2618 TaxID=3156454 RepID=UPI003398EF24
MHWTGRAAPHDQFALNAAIHLENLPTRFMEPTYNWICDLATPKWDAELGRFVRPVAPHRPIHVMHLAGPAKAREFDVDVIGGGGRRGKLLFGATYSETAP